MYEAIADFWRAIRTKESRDDTGDGKHCRGNRNAETRYDISYCGLDEDRWETRVGGFDGSDHIHSFRELLVYLRGGRHNRRGICYPYGWLISTCTYHSRVSE